jgi:hypothetical protein
MRGFLYQLTSLRLYHSLGEIFGVFSYLMAFALLESLSVMAILILIGVILPEKWFREGFAYKGFITVLVIGIAAIRLHYYLSPWNLVLPPIHAIYAGAVVTMVLLISFMLFFQNMPKLQKYVILAQERLQVFIYIYIPLGILGLAGVLLRNLL